MTSTTLIKLEIGYLLKPQDQDFEYHNDVYDKKYGYYFSQEHVYPIEDYSSALRKINAWIFTSGEDDIYGIIRKESEPRNTDAVIYSVARISDDIVPNFIENQDEPSPEMKYIADDMQSIRTLLNSTGLGAMNPDGGIKPYLKSRYMPKDKVQQIAWLLLNGAGCEFCRECIGTCPRENTERKYRFCTDAIADYIRDSVRNEEQPCAR